MSGSVKMLPLGDLCDVVGGGTPAKDKPHYYSGDIPWATVRDMRSEVITETEFSITREAVANSATSIIPSGNVVIATRVGLGKVCLVQRPTAINQDLRGIIPRNPERLTVRYLFWWLKSVAHLIQSAGTGATVQGVKLPFVRALQLPLRSVSEQRRIVAILDEAFDGIATVKANAEKNVRSAAELFDYHLQNIDGPKVYLGELVNIKTGKLDANAAVEGGAYPFFTCAREIYSIDKYAFDCEALLLAGNNAVGDFNVKHYKGKFNAYQRTYVITIKDEKKALCRFLYFELLKGLAKFKLQSVGAGTKFLKIGMINDLQVAFPEMHEQRRIASLADQVRQELATLSDLYQKKLAELEEFKKSLLHQAFTGQL